MIRLFLFLILFSFSSLPAEPVDPTKMTAAEYLSLEKDQIFPKLGKMTKDEAKILSNEVLQEARKSYNQADHFYYLIQHLESIRAIEEEQSRLKSVFWVFGLVMIVFFGYVGYLIYQLRQFAKN